MAENKRTNYETEWQDTLSQLRAMNDTYHEFDYFYRLALQYADRQQLKNLHPRVIMLGHQFPDEIVRSLGEIPMYLLGGSLCDAVQSESVCPRNADHAFKAAVGRLTDEETAPDRDTIVLVPLISDNMRRLGDLLGRRFRIIPFEVPMDKEDPAQLKLWRDEILRVSSVLMKHLKKRLSRRALIRECEHSAACAAAWKAFCRLSQQTDATICGSAKMLIAASYHWCIDKSDWCTHLQALTEEIRQVNADSKVPLSLGRVMLIGSPIYPPNYKIPILIEESNLRIYTVIHPDAAHIASAKPCSGSRKEMLHALADRYLNADISSAFVTNNKLQWVVRHKLEKGNIQGVIMHVLKNQIEYDFELMNLERILDEFDIPIMRLETDYNYEDEGQLRIRLEAFSETLYHRAKVVVNITPPTI